MHTQDMASMELVEVDGACISAWAAGSSRTKPSIPDHTPPPTASPTTFPTDYSIIFPNDFPTMFPSDFPAPYPVPFRHIPTRNQ